MRTHTSGVNRRPAARPHLGRDGRGKGAPQRAVGPRSVRGSIASGVGEALGSPPGPQTAPEGRMNTNEWMARCHGPGLWACRGKKERPKSLGQRGRNRQRPEAPRDPDRTCSDPQTPQLQPPQLARPKLAEQPRLVPAPHPPIPSRPIQLGQHPRWPTQRPHSRPPPPSSPPSSRRRPSRPQRRRRLPPPPQSGQRSSRQPRRRTRRPQQPGHPLRPSPLPSLAQRPRLLPRGPRLRQRQRSRACLCAHTWSRRVSRPAPHGTHAPRAVQPVPVRFKPEPGVLCSPPLLQPPLCSATHAHGTLPLQRRCSPPGPRAASHCHPSLSHLLQSCRC